MRQKGDEMSLTQKPQNPQNPHLPRARRVTVHLHRLIPPWQYWMKKRIRLPTLSRLFNCFRLWIRTFKSYRCASSLSKELVLFLQDVGDVGFFLFFFFFLYSPPFLIERLFLIGGLDFMLAVVETPNLRGQFGLLSLSYLSSDD